jgi:DNA-binding XRE family transcriptional regulator
LKKTIYYKKHGKLIRCLLTNENFKSCHGLPILEIKGEVYGAGGVALIDGFGGLYSYDAEAVKWGECQFYDITLLKNAIREAREKAELTQAELAEKIGVCSKYVQSWEYGKRKPNGENLVKLAEILNAQPKDLL